MYCCIYNDNIIYKVDLDGHNPTTILANLGRPNGIAIDHLHSRVCWTSIGKYKGDSDL